jgi:RNA polymerase sigma-70 factor (ECF subfamily)
VSLSAEAVLRHQKRIFGLAYRMTGTVADAEDVVHDTWLRFMSRPPERSGELDDVGPWLVTVASNVARDRLRRRRRERYLGPWLPSPIDTSRVDLEPVSADGGGEARYTLLESVSYAFLVALEVLTPTQRAVLLLRDVLDLSERSVAEALGLSRGAVAVHLHRARKKMEHHDRVRDVPSSETSRAAVLAFVAALARGDVDGVKALLAEDVTSLSDGGGEVTASVVPLIGRERVATTWAAISRTAPPVHAAELVELSGLPFVVASRGASGREAQLVALSCRVDSAGRIIAIYSVLAPKKLMGIVDSSRAVP